MSDKKIYSTELGINLRKKTEAELFKWFLASLLFGRPIQQEVAKSTYFEFKKENLLTSDKILRAGWDKLVRVLDNGHYVRYDFSTATKLLEICKALKREYGNLTKLIKLSKNTSNLSRKLQEFKGIGPTTARIFIRDLKRFKVI
jgi:endonuclease III